MMMVMVAVFSAMMRLFFHIQSQDGVHGGMTTTRRNDWCRTVELVRNHRPGAAFAISIKHV